MTLSDGASEDVWRVPWLAARARLSPGDPALHFAGETFDYATLQARVEGVVQTLARAGVARRDLVALHLPNGPPMVELVHAGFAGDFVVQLVNTRLTACEIEFQLRDSGARFFLHLSGDENAESVVLDAGVTRLTLADARSAASLEAPASTNDDPARDCARQIDLAAPRFILYTSGTSGRPKGVVLSGANLLASATGSAALLGAQVSTRWLLCLPVFHVGGLSILLRSVLAGTSVVLHERFDPEAVARDLDREPITGISLVANMLARVLQVRTQAAPPKSLACVLLGGGPAPAPLLEAARKAGFPVAPTYGLTEAASQVATRLPGEAPGLGLTPLPGTEVEIVDDTGRVCAPGDSGEIRVRGACVMREYWRRPDATRETLRGGWLHTGDVGSLDAAGRLHVFDRRSDLIVSGGENVYPAEVEAVLLEHPTVAEAGVAGVPDDVYGARPAAWLVATQGHVADVAALRTHCRERLAGYKCPVAFHFVDALPRTGTGKLLRRELGRGRDEAGE